jgi:hypothetical protein
MAGPRGAAELGHVAEDREPAPVPRQVSEGFDRGPNGLGVRVVGIVNYHYSIRAPTDFHPPPAARDRGAQPVRDVGEAKAELGGTSRASHEEIGEFAARIAGSSGSGLAGLIAVGEEAAPILAGAQRVRSWHGEAVGVPDGAAALAVLGDRLKPGDVVLVKASRAAQLEGVAADLLGELGGAGR